MFALVKKFRGFVNANSKAHFIKPILGKPLARQCGRNKIASEPAADRAGNIDSVTFLIGHENHVITVITKPMAFSQHNYFWTEFIFKQSVPSVRRAARGGQPEPNSPRLSHLAELPQPVRTDTGKKRFYIPALTLPFCAITHSLQNWTFEPVYYTFAHNRSKRSGPHPHSRAGWS